MMIHVDVIKVVSLKYIWSTIVNHNSARFIQICLRPDPNSIEFYFDVNVFLLANLNEYIELDRNVS